MACPAIHTGSGFLQGALLHVDCQAQAIGSYGWGAMADAGSPVSLAMVSLLTIFIAAFGLRVMLGYPLPARDGVTAMLKIGIVLTLATSWPAWRVVGYDLFIDGPAQLAHVIGVGAGLPGSAGDLATRLQTLDSGFAALTDVGSGRLGVAQGDWFQLGFARSAFLVGTLGPEALIRLATGFLLAIGPLMAGLLLFGVTRGLFEGWLRALVATFLGSILLTLVLGTELALAEPWLQDVLDQRAAKLQTLDAPVEALVLTLAFALVSFAGLFFVARLAFHPGAPWIHLEAVSDTGPRGTARTLTPAMMQASNGEAPEPHRALLVGQAISENARRETRLAQVLQGQTSGSNHTQIHTTGAPGAASPSGGAGGALGNSWRRPASRVSGAARRRDTHR